MGSRDTGSWSHGRRQVSEVALILTQIKTKCNLHFAPEISLNELLSRRAKVREGDGVLCRKPSPVP
jgi:hypothetical protein